MKIKEVVSAMLLAAAASAGASEMRVSMHMVDEKGMGKEIGSVTLTESRYGVVFTPSLGGLPAGLHGFHVHENASCAAGEKDGKMTAGAAAGGHYDPAGTKKHGTPWGDGHLGDLPALYVAANGEATYPVLAPRLKMSDLKGRALMIHAGGENHADHPAALGGGGARIACGMIK